MIEFITLAAANYLLAIFFMFLIGFLIGHVNKDTASATLLSRQLSARIYLSICIMITLIELHEYDLSQDIHALKMLLVGILGPAMIREIVGSVVAGTAIFVVKSQKDKIE